jgi:hypothetical protein
MQGGKPVNVSSSITPLKGERLTETRPKPQWIDIDWKKAEEHQKTTVSANTLVFREVISSKERNSE